jgi:8-oxo-dGTP diphosphatase
MATMAHTGLILAAGGVLWRRAAGGMLEVAVVHRPKYDDWSLPKGKVAAGEHPLAAAVREIAEETGYRARLSRPLPTRRYLYRDRPKEVRYWAAEALDGGFAANAEVDRLDWLPAPAARDRLSHAQDAEVLDALRSRPVGVYPLIVLRHSAAVGRGEWDGDDEQRPLSGVGAAQTRALMPLLDAYLPPVVLSSPARRCVDTVRGYAEAHGFAVETEALLSEESFVAAPETMVKRAAGLLAEGTGAVLCTHRPVLPGLLAGIGADPPSPRLNTAHFLALHPAAGRVVEVEHHSA